MQIKNNGQEARTLSRDGVDIPLLPGASVEFDLTKDEAKAYQGIGFEVTGEPVKASPAPKPEK